MQFKFLSLILISSIALSACKKSQSNTDSVNANAAAQAETVSTFHYYLGGFYAPQNSPNWTNDMTISFTSSGFSITGKHSDPLCSRSGNFSEPQAAELFNLVSRLLLAPKRSTDPMGADSGVEYIEITTVDGRVRRYYLASLTIAVGELYATNPTELRNYLQTLEASLATACR